LVDLLALKSLLSFDGMNEDEEDWPPLPAAVLAAGALCFVADCLPPAGCFLACFWGCSEGRLVASCAPLGLALELD